MLLILKLIGMLVLSVVAGIFYRIGGGDHPKWLPTWFSQKLFRTVGIGLLVGIPFAIINQSLFPLLCAGSYFLPEIFPYGEKSWMKIPDRWKFLINGAAFGIASLPAIGLRCILQAVIAAGAWVGIKILDDKNIMKNPWVERAKGFLGTIII